MVVRTLEAVFSITGSRDDSCILMTPPTYTIALFFFVLQQHAVLLSGGRVVARVAVEAR